MEKKKSKYLYMPDHKIKYSDELYGRETWTIDKAECRYGKNVCLQ